MLEFDISRDFHRNTCDVIYPSICYSMWDLLMEYMKSVFKYFILMIMLDFETKVYFLEAWIIVEESSLSVSFQNAIFINVGKLVFIDRGIIWRLHFELLIAPCVFMLETYCLS